MRNRRLIDLTSTPSPHFLTEARSICGLSVESLPTDIELVSPRDEERRMGESLERGVKLPLLHLPSRRKPVEPFPKPRAINLCLIRNAISTKLTSTKWMRRIQTDRVFIKDSPKLESAKGIRPDSFEQKYSSKEHTYKHQLVGTVHIRQGAARTLGALNLNRSLTVNREIEEAKAAIQRRTPYVPVLLNLHQVREKPWRAFSAIKHLIQLKVPLYLIPKLGELVPQQPYQHPKAYAFIKACRYGNSRLVRRLISENRWLALSFDHIKQTGLHWLAKRGYFELIPDLVKAGAFIDARDSAGRTPLYLAAYKGNLNEVRTLLAQNANPFLKSNSGKTAQMVSRTAVMQKIVEKSMLLHLLLKFVPSETRAAIWEKEGLEYFQASVDVISISF